MDKKEFKDKANKADFIDTINRFIYEVRLYPKEGESFTRFVLWLITWGIGVYFYYYLNNPFAAIPNYMLMAGSYLEDIYYNKINGDEPKEYLTPSILCNLALFGITVVILALSGLQLLEYVAKQTIKSSRFYTTMIWLGALLLIKPLADFVLMCLFKNSRKVIYDNQNVDLAPYLTASYKSDLEKAANIGALTESEDNKGTK